MPNTKTSKRVKKTKNLGKAINALEHADHRTKLALAKKKAGANNARQKPGGKHPFNPVLKLLGTKQIQEIAYVHCVMDPGRYAAAMPITMVTGAVPVDLYRVTAEASSATLTNGSNEAFVMAWPDGWYAGYDGNHVGGDANRLLHVNGGSSSAGIATGATYAAAAFPGTGTLVTGSVAMPVPDVSADFSSSAKTGTQYIQVGAQLQLSMVLPPQANDKLFEGEVFAFYTKDPERYPIAGTTPGTLITQSKEAGSSVSAVRYGIMPDGRFYLKEDFGTGQAFHSGSSTGVLKLSCFPLSPDAFKWRRIGEGTLVGATVGSPDTCVGFYINAPSTTQFRTNWVSVYQVEKYPTMKLGGSAIMTGSSSAEELMGQLNHLVQATIAGMQPHPGSPAASVLDHYNNKNPGFLSSLLGKGKDVLGKLYNSGLLGALWNAIKGSMEFGSVTSAIQNMPLQIGPGPSSNAVQAIETSPGVFQGGGITIEEIEEAAEVGEELALTFA